jgi:transposase
MQYYKDIENFVKGKKVFCGIDVYLKSWNVCFYYDGETLERSRIDFGYFQLLKLLKRYNACREKSIVYEAGFIGFSLYRKLISDGYRCIITPPVLIPRTGSKVKIDKRDAQKLASYLSAGILKSIYVPPPEVESDRGVVRRRAQLVKNQTRCKSQIKSFLYLRGITRPKQISKHWSNGYLSWLAELEFPSASDLFTFRQLIKTYRRIREDIVEVTGYLKTLSKEPCYSI